MIKLIIFLAISGFLAFLLATGMLVYLNWSPKLWTPVVTALAIGTITGFVSIAVALKSSEINDSFGTSILVFNNKIAAPDYIPTTHEAQRRMNLVRLLNSPQIKSDSSNAETVMNTALEASQYELLVIIRDIQKGGWVSSYIGGVTKPTVNSPLLYPTQ